MNRSTSCLRYSVNLLYMVLCQMLLWKHNRELIYWYWQRNRTRYASAEYWAFENTCTPATSVVVVSYLHVIHTPLFILHSSYTSNKDRVFIGMANVALEQKKKKKMLLMIETLIVRQHSSTKSTEFRYIQHVYYSATQLIAPIKNKCFISLPQVSVAIQGKCAS